MAATTAPVITAMHEDQIKSFAAFIEGIRVDNSAAAKAEAARLRPYFNALFAKLKQDAGAVQKAPAEISVLSQKGGLFRLFTAVARRTNNTILSELMVMPEALLNDKSATTNSTQFNAQMNYEGASFSLGFLQAFDDAKTSSTSIPLLALNTDMMARVDPFQTERLLRAMQTIATAGNHDMLHHYTNTVLNNSIARPNMDGALPPPVATATDWFNKYFQYNKDSDITSYESWLMLDHRRVRRLMEEGPEGRALEQACDTFFEELARIGREMKATASAAEVHKTVDYFGTLLLFTMMRYMPLDHPLMLRALKKLEEADPAPPAMPGQAPASLAGADAGYMNGAVVNYARHGLSMSYPAQDYAELKRLQLIELAPWIAHLLSPALRDTPLAEMQGEPRLGSANIDMIRNAAAGIWLNMKNGRQSLTRPNGTTVEAYLRNGRLTRRNGPALTETAPDGAKKETWYKNGAAYRMVETKANGEYHEKWYGKNGAHRTNGPAIVDILPDGSRHEQWSLNGQLSRLNGPAVTNISADGSREERWYLADLYHRVDGPAVVKTAADGRVLLESWWQNGLRHRDGGPALVDISADGTKEESWYKDGESYRENAPAYLRTAADGTVTKEVWWKDGAPHREGGPARFEKFARGGYKEEWIVDGKPHRLDGPATIEVSADGTGEETWYKDGKVHRLGGPAYLETAADGTVLTELWRRDGQKHREDGPALVRKSADGAHQQEWFINGEHHRLDGPAVIEISADGSRKESWKQNGKGHRLDGPSYVETAADGKLLVEVWWKNGKRHREDGPAHTTVLPDGTKKEQWFRDGVEIEPPAPRLPKMAAPVI